MLLQRLSILITVLLLPLISRNNGDTNLYKTAINLQYSLSIDSLNEQIKYAGWDSELLNRYRFAIVNSKHGTDINLQGLPAGYEVSFLNALLLKKEQRYEEMFDTLFTSLSDKINFLPYYEELVFSASAINKLNLLEEKFSGNDSDNYEFISGLIKSAKSLNKEAADYFTKALKKNNDKHIYFQLSYAHRSNGDYENGSQTLTRAENIFSDDKWFTAKVKLAQGSLYFLSGDYDNAKKHYNAGYLIAVKNNDKQNEARSCINLGIIEDISGNVEKAHDYFNKAIEITSDIGDYENLATAYSELGVSYTFTNRLPEAKVNYLKCLNIFKKMNNWSRLSLLHNNLGKIYITLFDYESALNHFEEGLKFAGDNKRSQALNLTGIADVYANLSNYTKAIQYYREAQGISSEIKEVSLSTEINSGLGLLNFNLERFGNAIEYFSSAQKYAEETGNPFQQADVLHKIGISYYELDSLETAETYFKKALNLSEENSILYYESLISIDLASLQLKNKKYEDAVNNIHSAENKAKESDFDYLLARAKLVGGEIEKETGNFKKAEKLFKEALTIAYHLNEFSLQVEANYNLAKLFEENGFNEAAELYYKTAAVLIENISRPLFKENEVQISYFSTHKDLYDSFASFYLKEKKYKEAFELIDKSHSRNTVQNLSNLKLQVMLENKKLLEKIYEYEWIIHSGIYDKSKVNEIKKDYSVLKESLISEKPAIAKYLNKQNHFSINDVQENLADKQYFLSFYLTDNNSFIFVVSGDDFKYYKIPYSKSEIIKLKNRISPYFTADKNQNTFYNQDLFSFNVKAANDFYNTFLKDALSDIPDGSSLVISPPEELVSLPFDFLVASFNEGESAYDYKDKDYLIFHYNISYAPSASVFVHQKINSLKTSDKILIAGNPEINSHNSQYAERRGLLEESAGLPRNVSMLPLKYSGEEINSISDLIDADRILTDNAATETGFKENAEFSKIIHLSTHSFLFNKQPVIFFSNNNDEKNDGFLEAGEIVQLKLNSDLVVLSSCNSGLGSIDASEGIIGMTKAFFEAGSKSVIVSLWEVNDKYTSKLMTLLYKKLSEGYDKDEAMRLAKIDFIKNYSPNPYFWSAFILSGNTESLELKSKPEISVFLAGLSVILLAAVIFFVRKRTKNIS